MPRPVFSPKPVPIGTGSKYFYSVLGAEVGHMCRFFARRVMFRDGRFGTERLHRQLTEGDGAEPYEFEQSLGDFLDSDGVEEGERACYLLNGNVNFSEDVATLLGKFSKRLRPRDRLVLVLYNPFYRWLYLLAARLHMMACQGPTALMTHEMLEGQCALAGLEIVRRRRAVLLPFYIPVTSNFANRVLAGLPGFRSLAWTWVVSIRSTEAPQPARRDLVSVIVPARNEAGNVRHALDRLPEFPDADVELIYVEGNSSDDTWKTIQEIVADQAGKPSSIRVKAVQQTGRGKYDAVRRGFAVAEGNVLMILDADLTVAPEMLPRFHEAYRKSGGALVNGNRLLYPMETGAMRFLNWLGNLFFARALAHLLELPLGDSLCGTKVISAENWRWLERWRRQFGDHDPFGDFDLLFASAELSLGLVEIPVRYRARTYGSTQIQRFRDGAILLEMAKLAFGKIYLPKLPWV